MPKKQKVNLQFDPTLPTSEIRIGDKSYRMCFDFAALANAEAALQAQGIPCNVLASIGLNSLASVQTMFAVSLRRFHPDVPWDEACGLVTWQTFKAIRPAVAYALNEALADPADSADSAAGDDDENPPQP